ncbi:SDR family NAD(P)-dependent oxidoreductase [Sinomonas sp. JGH33]|uniref:SDR family NAD(P)-dependent oxidoreductase n=1 Tax=Sinomonas terricola TaxID=3110330 RepID=A0ABU5T3R9_9MICC|nr:SDR family NAD(P)-dependent oxidoreductase [Sinomonas sp. JGH33]MEA5454300.1 SDR family NAD(P)-dependent oxidoreductase [Sinomonas sp. JGH33]
MSLGEETTSPRGAQDAVVVVAGATSASGEATVRALRAAGAIAVAVGSNAARLEAAFGAPGGADDGGVPQRECDLADFGAVQALAAELRATFGAVDGVIHLVGGWRGGGTLADQSDEDWEFLERGSIATLRNTSRAFFDDIEASPRGRFVIVSSTLIEHPRAGYANYAAAKAAAEAWTRAMARGLAAVQAERKEAPLPQTSAAVVLAVKSLLDDDMRAEHPERKFPGYTHVDDLAARAVALFTEDAAAINGARFDLSA